MRHIRVPNVRFWWQMMRFNVRLCQMGPGGKLAALRLGLVGAWLLTEGLLGVRWLRRRYDGREG